MSNEQQSTELLDESQALLKDAEQLLAEAAASGGAEAQALYARVAERLRLAKGQLLEAEQVVINRAKQAAKATDTYVHDHPWQAVGIAAAVGVLVGMLISRR
ncbi:DUF883 family protein [Chitinilyticum piscinae]|uniref:DUF883 domain-containing protein n=1 Tax=Chitinilyticum piscinae TaxID=2866724 RepID=A0A8J7FE33_9NEIS|nr:DUF883 family protein [Chitinilyticum piscinae]MBE9607728.1 DUF883 domain-containing protein [Chitinilyticum piscinae]